MSDAANNDGDILEPQGTHYGWFSLKPLTEASEWAATPGTYFKKLKEANGGAPIYKAHPGLACIAITDHAGGKWFFEQPDTVLDRQVSRESGKVGCCAMRNNRSCRRDCLAWVGRADVDYDVNARRHRQ